LEENLGSATVALTAEELNSIQSAVEAIEMQGARYPQHLQQRVGR